MNRIELFSVYASVRRGARIGSLGKKAPSELALRAAEQQNSRITEDGSLRVPQFACLAHGPEIVRHATHDSYVLSPVVHRQKKIFKLSPSKAIRYAISRDPFGACSRLYYHQVSLFRA